MSNVSEELIDELIHCKSKGLSFTDGNLRLTVSVAETRSFPQTKVYSAESSLLVFMIFS